MPKIKEYVYFDECAYQNKICQSGFSDKQVRDRIYAKRRKINTATFAIGTGLALVLATGGISSVTLPLGARVLCVASEKLRLLENEWSRRGYQTLPIRFVKDFVIPCVVSGTFGVVGMDVDFDFSAAGAEAVNNAALAGGNQLAAATLQTHHLAPGTGSEFWDGAADGAQQAIGFIGHPESTYFTPASAYNTPAYALGQGAGVNAVHRLVDSGVKKAGNWTQDHTVGKR